MTTEHNPHTNVATEGRTPKAGHSKRSLIDGWKCCEKRASRWSLRVNPSIDCRRRRAAGVRGRWAQFRWEPISGHFRRTWQWIRALFNPVLLPNWRGLRDIWTRCVPCNWATLSPRPSSTGPSFRAPLLTEYNLDWTRPCSSRSSWNGWRLVGELYKNFVPPGTICRPNEWMWCPRGVVTDCRAPKLLWCRRKVWPHSVVLYDGRVAKASRKE